MKKLIPALVMLSVSVLANAQTKTDTVYFDRNWKKKVKDDAAFYRLVTKDGALYKVEDHYKSGQVQMTGSFSSTDPEVKDGYFKYYLKNGVVTEECNFINDKRDGDWKRYYDDGKIESVDNYKNGVITAQTSYYYNGNISSKSTYSGGKINGDFTTYYHNGNVKKKAQYTNGDLLNWVAYDTTGKQLKPGQDPDSNDVFTVVQHMPQFKGNLSQYLSDHLTYPEIEREAGITGKVYVTFVVEKDGSVTGVKVLRGVPGGPGLDSESVKVVKEMPPWDPGMQNGHLVRVQFNLPINFHLNEPDPIFSITQLQHWPTFPAGALNYVIGHLNKSKDSDGEAYVSFIVGADGTLSDVTLISGTDNLLNSEVINTIKDMGKWTPGKKDGRAVRTKMYLKVKPSDAPATHNEADTVKNKAL